MEMSSLRRSLHLSKSLGVFARVCQSFLCGRTCQTKELGSPQAPRALLAHVGHSHSCWKLSPFLGLQPMIHYYSISLWWGGGCCAPLPPPFNLLSSPSLDDKCAFACLPACASRWLERSCILDLLTCTNKSRLGRLIWLRRRNPSNSVMSFPRHLPEGEARGKKQLSALTTFVDFEARNRVLGSKILLRCPWQYLGMFGKFAGNFSLQASRPGNGTNTNPSWPGGGAGA